MKNILAIIPARGGSKAIPRKNIRPLNGKPLIFYSIKNALSSKYITDTYVSSDDQEILTLAKKFGSKTHKRQTKLAEDQITLDPVIYQAYKEIQKKEKKNYDIIITLQPTSPLLSTHSLDKAIEKIINDEDIETVISAKKSTHLSWKLIDNKYIPNYEKRVNRQNLTPEYTETGGFLITKANIISKKKRIGESVHLHELNFPESIDIDTYDDWALCDYYMKRKKILIITTGNTEIGLGHIYNTLLIAHNLLKHEITFLVDKNSELGKRKIKDSNYKVYMQENQDIIDDIKKLKPDVIINDLLDTNITYMKSLRKIAPKIINFEDLGKGAQYADLVINAIYPEKQKLKKHYFGPKYFLLRDEFIFSEQKEIKDTVENILIIFGGTDPNNLTNKALNSILPYCKQKNIKINIITGLGYRNLKDLKKIEEDNSEVRLLNNIRNVSDFILMADLIFTSAGRTIYEIASIGTPAIVLAQNHRELTHFFAYEKYGFLNLGLGKNVENKKIIEALDFLINNKEQRVKMSNRMKANDLKNGTKRVIKLINELIEE